MALYLGKERMAVTLPVEVPASSETQKIASGTIMSNMDGIVTFPKLDFEPKLIALWNIESFEEEWGDGETIQGFNGFSLFAIHADDQWYSQSIISDSGGIVLTNESYDLDGDDEPDNFPYYASAVSINEEGCYCYRMGRGSSYQDFLDEIYVNYIIYG